MGVTKRGRAVTVQELISYLSTLPPDLPVVWQRNYYDDVDYETLKPADLTVTHPTERKFYRSTEDPSVICISDVAFLDHLDDERQYVSVLLLPT